MGKIALAAKVAYMPPATRPDSAGAEGLQEIGHRARLLGVDTVVVFDSQWDADGCYAVNCNAWVEGGAAAGTPYGAPGNPALGEAIVEAAAHRGVPAGVHAFDNLPLSHGTVVPMQAMNADQHFRVVACAAGLGRRPLEDSRAFGAAVREAIVRSDCTVMVVSSGPLSCERDVEAPAHCSGSVGALHRQVDLRVLDLWQQRAWPTFCAMLVDNDEDCDAAGGMHDTAMLLGLLGWDEYDREVEIVTPYATRTATRTATGAVNVIFPVD